jgi:hypothetical protein
MHCPKCQAHHGVVQDEDDVAEDILPGLDEEEELDDSNVNLQDILSATHQEEPPAQCHGQIAEHKKGGLTTIADAENLDELPVVVDNEEVTEKG